MKLVQGSVTIELTETEKDDLIEEIATMVEEYDCSELPMLNDLWHLLVYKEPPSKTPKGKKGKNKEQGRYPNYNRIDD